MEKYKINKPVSLKSIELWTKTRLISNKRNRMLLSLVSSGCSKYKSHLFRPHVYTFLDKPENANL